MKDFSIGHEIAVSLGKIILIIFLLIIFFIAGLMIGFGVVGKGTPMDVLTGETWSHIFDFLR